MESYWRFSMSDEFNGRLEKYMEGTSLGLAALAEVLQKMDARLTKAEEVDVEAEIAKAEADERNALVKDVASAVVSMLKATDDLDGEKERKAKSSGPVNASGDDSSTTVAPPTAAADQQATIQAEAEDDEEEDEEKSYPMKADEDDEAEDEEKAEMDDDENEDEEKAMYGRMKKQIDALHKELADSKANIAKAVQEESEARLRKMGFKEETRLVAPKATFGKDEVDIVKATESVDVNDLANLSYGELRKLQFAVQNGEVTL
jgi:cellobiose-specific phosphotransferase system component IIB